MVELCGDIVQLSKKLSSFWSKSVVPEVKNIEGGKT